MFCIFLYVILSYRKTSFFYHIITARLACIRGQRGVSTTLPFCFIQKYYICSRQSPNWVTYTGTADPSLRFHHAHPDETAGSHSRKMLLAEIPVLFYLIISDCHASRHNPLLLKTYVFYLHGQQCYPLQVHLRTKWDSATPLSSHKRKRIKRRK